MSEIKLTAMQQSALCEFEPGHWYGSTRPSRSASRCKGRLCDLGLVEHDGEFPVSFYRLTPEGIAVRAALLPTPPEGDAG